VTPDKNRFLGFVVRAVAIGPAAVSLPSAARCAGARPGSSSRGGHSARTVSPQTWRLFANHVLRLHRQLRECFIARKRSGDDRPRLRARRDRDHLPLHPPLGRYPGRDHRAGARDPLVRGLPQVTRPARRAPDIAARRASLQRTRLTSSLGTRDARDSVADASSFSKGLKWPQNGGTG